jgi:hypothetical protein
VLVYAKRSVAIERPVLLRFAPAVSALVVTLIGVAMTVEALQRVGG